MRVERDDGGIQVMEHREPPRIAAGDRRFDGAIEEPASSFRLRAFDPFSDRRHIDLVRAGCHRRWRRWRSLRSFSIWDHARRLRLSRGCIANLSTKLRLKRFSWFKSLRAGTGGESVSFSARVRTRFRPAGNALSTGGQARSAGCRIQAGSLGGRSASRSRIHPEGSWLT